MNRNKAKILWAGMAIALFAATIVWNWQDVLKYFNAEPVIEKPVAAIPAPYIPAEELMARFEAAQEYQPSPEELAEDAAFEAEQIADARQWLSDPDPEQRVVGAEQLSAYPTPETEQFLAEVLAGDVVDEVKVAAANSLVANKSASLKTREALIVALQDANEDVRNAALNTLQTYLGADSESSTAKKTLAMLKKQLKSKRVPQETRQAIKDYLLDQFPEN